MEAETLNECVLHEDCEVAAHYDGNEVAVYMALILVGAVILWRLTKVFDKRNYQNDRKKKK